MRAKALYADYNIANESVDVHISPTAEWVKNSGEYYYLSSIVSGGENILFIDQLTLPNIVTEVRNNTIISVMFEFLEYDLDVANIWQVDTSIFRT